MEFGKKEKQYNQEFGVQFFDILQARLQRLSMPFS
jgi:hypothetical protein